MMNRTPREFPIQVFEFEKLEKTSSIAIAFNMLYRAACLAADSNCSLWDFSISIMEFADMNVSPTDLRWLLAKGYVVHAKEITLAGESRRRFSTLKNFTIPQEACFVLAKKGMEFVQSRHTELQTYYLSQNGANDDTQVILKFSSNGHNASPISSTPFWNTARRELSYLSRIIRRFQRRAPNQEVILAAFQEEGWPARIDDPLPPMPDQVASCRLQDAIRALNHNQKSKLIRFRSDGNGKGILWEELVAEE